MGKKVKILAWIDDKNLCEDALIDEAFDELCLAQDHGKNGQRHLIGRKEVKDESNGSLVCESGIVDVRWMYGDNAVRITLLAIGEYNCGAQWEVTREAIFNDYRRVFKEWEQPDRDIKVEFYELQNTLTVMFYWEVEE